MTMLRNRIAATAAAISLGVGLALTSSPAAQARSVPCMPSKGTVSCSKYWANRANPAKPTSSSILNLQRALVQVGYPIKPLTGTLNSTTRARLQSYQRERAIKVTGKFDQQTVKALRAGRPKLVSTAGKAAKVVAYANRQLGKPYRSGAVGPSAFDCSGLTMAAYKSAGRGITRTSYAQLSAHKSVPKSALQPGDIVGFYGGGHVATYVGKGYVIHASRPGRPVAKVKLSTMPFYKAVRPVI